MDPESHLPATRDSGSPPRCSAGPRDRTLSYRVPEPSLISCVIDQFQQPSIGRGARLLIGTVVGSLPSYALGLHPRMNGTNGGAGFMALPGLLSALWPNSWAMKLAN